MRRAFSWLVFMLHAVREILATRKDVPLVIVSNPPILPLLGLGMNLIRGQRYLIVVYDIYPDVLIALGRLTYNNPVSRAWRFLNRLIYQRASNVITLGKYMANKLGKYLPRGIANNRVSIVPTWVDTSRYTPLDKRKNWFAVAHGQVNKLTVLYSGNIGFTHDIELLVDAADWLKNEEVFHFLIIGAGSGKERMMEKAHVRKLSNITFLPFQRDEVFPFSLATGDIAVVSVRKGLEGLIMPSKTYYSMAVGSALLGLSCPPNDLAELIYTYDCGLNVATDNLEGFVTAIKKFREDEQFLNKCRTNSRIAAESYFSRSRVTPEITELVKSAARA